MLLTLLQLVQLEYVLCLVLLLFKPLLRGHIKRFLLLDSWLAWCILLISERHFTVYDVMEALLMLLKLYLHLLGVCDRCFRAGDGEGWRLEQLVGGEELVPAPGRTLVHGVDLVEARVDAHLGVRGVRHVRHVRLLLRNVGVGDGRLSWTPF